MANTKINFSGIRAWLSKKSGGTPTLPRQKRRTIAALESLEARAVTAADLQVSLWIGTENLSNDIVQQYYAGSIGSDGWFTDPSNKDTKFNYLETHQIPVPSKYTNNQFINVKVSETQGNGINSTTYPGFAVFLKNGQVKNGSSPQFNWGQEIKGLQVSSKAPVHLTIIPYNYATKVYMPNKAYAIWLSAMTTNNNTVISKDLGWSTPDDTIQNLGLVRPQWRYSPTKNTLSFIGSLDRYNEFNGMGDRGNLYGTDVSLTLGDKVNLDIPLTNSQAVIHLPTNLTEQQLKILKRLDGKSDLRAISDSEQKTLDSIMINKDSPNWLKIIKPKLDSKVEINGFGRINGYTTYRNAGGVPPTDLNEFYSKIRKNNGRASLLDQIVTGQYMIRSALTEIHSTQPIHMEGVSVGYGPIRNQEFIQLGSDKTVTLFDVKTPGAFRGASDGPVIDTDNAHVSYLYLHHSDDSIKVYADEQHFSDITLIQGNAGAAIDLGAYGYNKPINKGSTVKNVYIHRIMQLYSGYDRLGGVITTRNKATGAEINNVTIEGVYIANMGTNGPNWYFRKTAIGFVPGGLFGSKNEKVNKATTISNLKIEPFSGLAPMDQLVYDYKNPKFYYWRREGRLWYNLGFKQGNAIMDKNFPMAPSGNQYGIFKEVHDNS
jgi:hypothetical protein